MQSYATTTLGATLKNTYIYVANIKSIIGMYMYD